MLTQEAKELGFSARTLQRDLHEIERAGFPLAEIAAGRYGFAEGFSLRKMPLSARDKALLALTGGNWPNLWVPTGTPVLNG